MNSNIITEVVSDWLNKWVIDLNLCPFARPVKIQDQIRFSVCDCDTVKEVLTFLTHEYRLMDAEPDIGTTLVILSSDHIDADFFAFLHLLDKANSALMKRWEGIYQLASFHPDYVFAGEAGDGTSHYSNRAPLPILHILREDHVSRATQQPSIADVIVQRNQDILAALGKPALTAQLSRWRQRLHR